MKKIVFIASIAIFMLVSCTNENDVLNNNTIDQKKSFAHSIVKIDGKEIPYLTFSDPDSIGIGDTICNFTAMEVDESMHSSLRSDIAANDKSILDDLVDFPLNIIVRESNSSARYLTNQGLNNEIHLENYDANNNVKHTFYLQSIPFSSGLYFETPVRVLPLISYFQRRPVLFGYNNSNPNVNIIFVGDNSSGTTGGILWDFSQSQRVVADDGAYIISIFNPLNIGGKLCMQAEGTNIRFGTYASKGTQEFVIRPLDDFNMISLELFVDNSSFVVRQPDFVDVLNYYNPSDLVQEMSTSFSRKASYTSSFSRENSVSLSVASTLKVGGALFVGGSISTTTATSFKWTYGKSESYEDTRTYNFPIKIAPKTKAKVTLSIAQYEMNLKYRAQFQGKTTGKIFTEIGNWKGIDCTEINVDLQVTNADGSAQYYTFHGVPTSTVVLGVSNGGSSKQLQITKPPLELLP